MWGQAATLKELLWVPSGRRNQIRRQIGQRRMPPATEPLPLFPWADRTCMGNDSRGLGLQTLVASLRRPTDFFVKRAGRRSLRMTHPAQDSLIDRANKLGDNGAATQLWKGRCLGLSRDVYPQGGAQARCIQPDAAKAGLQAFFIVTEFARGRGSCNLAFVAIQGPTRHTAAGSGMWRRQRAD